MTTAPLMTSYSATGGRGRHQGRYAELHLSKGHDRLARKGKLDVAIGEENFSTFATVEIMEEGTAGTSAPIEIEADGVTIRLGAETPADRIAEIAAALRLAR
ncbi:MAG: hypothetical protein CMN57_04415 [Gammaproteobacteria bacterium]|nr:hypothetical protein [Gammaproteobacteria bacterium]